jgi:hypothetical protein
MKRVSVTSLALLVGLVFSVECKASFCVVCFQPNGQVLDAGNLFGQLTNIPLDQIGSLGSLTDAFSTTGSITYETPTTLSSLTGGYTAVFNFPNLNPGFYVISSYLNATLQSSLMSSTAVLTSASVTTEFFDISDTLLATVIASNGTLSAGPVTSAPFFVAPTTFVGLDHIDQIFSASFSGVQPGETLTLDFPNTSAVGTPGTPVPEPSAFLPIGILVALIGWKTARRFGCADRT